MTRIKLRRGTAAAAILSNPILSSGEPGFETDTGRFKIGDGSTAWQRLPFGGEISAGVRDLVSLTGQEVDRRIDGLSAGTSAQALFTTYDNSGSGTYVRSTTWFGHTLDLTGVTVATESAWMATAISPLHVVTAGHIAFLFTIGSWVRFKGSDGTVIQRTITSKETVGETDICVMKLNAALPATVRPVKVMMAYDTALMLNALKGSAFLYIKATTRKGYIGQSNGINGDFITPTVSSRIPFYAVAEDGDSGGPIFAVVDNELLLIGVFNSSAGADDPIFDNFDAVDDAMAMLGGGYQLTATSRFTGLENTAYLHATDYPPVAGDVVRFPVNGGSPEQSGLKAQVNLGGAVNSADYAYALYLIPAHAAPAVSAVSVDADGVLILANITGTNFATGIPAILRAGLGMSPQAANPDTSGATLLQLETEVNQLKALLRTVGLLTP